VLSVYVAAPQRLYGAPAFPCSAGLRGPHP
jgi:hypothetical protein